MKNPGIAQIIFSDSVKRGERDGILGETAKAYRRSDIETAAEDKESARKKELQTQSRC